ncbi:DUF308 domain-containing protein [Ruminococcaceae bacterium OttesenSCG-928-I18]|nr:DUF308 domain-containing protein [Ruminococcaceae bacterium OttesenSCG-928-I18]
MKVLSIILGILLIVGGFYMMFTPGITFLSVGWLIGFVFLLAGVNAIVDYFVGKRKGTSSVWDLVGGILCGILGVIILVSPYAEFLADTVLIYVFDFWLIIGGIVRIAGSIQMKKAGDRSWIWVLIIAILSVLLGAYALFHIVVSAVAIGWLLGFIVIMSGFNLIGLGTSLGGKGGGNKPAAG